MISPHSRLRGLAALAVAIATLAGAAGGAGASSCTGEGTPKKIVFKKGAVCWSYRGKAIAFAGRFASGQNITVRMTGVLESLEADGEVTSSIEPRDAFATGPGDFYAGGSEDEPGVLRFVVPQSGTYTISFSPCAMQGNMGDVEICAE